MPTNNDNINLLKFEQDFKLIIEDVEGSLAKHWT